MRRSFSCRRLHFWIVFSFCRRLNTYNMHTLHIMYIPWDRQLLNFANIESPQFGFRFHNRQVPSDQQTPEVIGTVCRNSAVLSNFRLDQEWTVESLKYPCRHSFFRLRRFNNQRTYGTCIHVSYTTNLDTANQTTTGFGGHGCCRMWSGNPR